MLYFAKELLIFICIIALNLPLWAQESDDTKIDTSHIKQEISSPHTQSQQTTTASKDGTKKDHFFLNWINTGVYAATIDKEEEKKILRKKLKKMLGIDIFYPYFKVKEVESWVKEKTNIKLFKIKGEPAFYNNQIKYIFNVEF